MRSGDLDPECGPGPLRAPSRHWRPRCKDWSRHGCGAFGASHLLSGRRGDCSTGRASKARVAAVYPDRAGIGIAKDIRLAGWLEAHSIRQVAPESTGVCRIAPCEVLGRRGFEIWLADPVGLARPDVPDCRRLRQPAGLGLLKRSHRLRDGGARQAMQRRAGAAG